MTVLTCEDITLVKKRLEYFTDRLNKTLPEDTAGIEYYKMEVATLKMLLLLHENLENFHLAGQ